MELLIGLALGAPLGALAAYAVYARRRLDVERAARALLDGAREQAERVGREAEDRIRAEEDRKRAEWEARAQRLREDGLEEERRLARREAAVDRRGEEVDAKERATTDAAKRLVERKEDLDILEQERRLLIERARGDLLRIAGLTRERAVEETLARFEAEVQSEAAARLKRVHERTEAEAEERAAKILAHAVQRLAVPASTESATSTVQVASEDMKGRIIGREGRNIRVFEKVTGVDVIIDDTPGVVVLSCFDNVRREVARRSLERLLKDGRIHPGRIEETVAAARREIDDDVRQTARKVLHELDLPRVDPRVQWCLGRLKYRTSYGQNQLHHAVEVAYLSAAIAAEMKLNAKLARRCGLFHDLGKALDHEFEGGHPEIGADLARRCDERPEVINAIAAHHGDVPFESVYGVIAQVADAISAARPGARRDTMDRYLQRLEKLERIAATFRGVESAYAIQAGRELRVIVDAAALDDSAALLCAREIARKIEAELAHPGEVKVTIIRETRVTEYAR